MEVGWTDGWMDELTDGHTYEQTRKLINDEIGGMGRSLV